MPRLSRRDLLCRAPAAGLGLAAILPSLTPRFVQAAPSSGAPREPGPLPSSFPQTDPDLVRQVVGYSHGRFDELRPLVEERPALAKTAIDWGFGDWETALGAASHMGRSDIAEFLIGHGARPDVFTFAMMGNLSVVRAMIEARPGLQALRGPHGITLLQHAKNGDATEVVAYLESLPDADPKYRDDPISDEDKASMQGEYVFGRGPEDVLVVKEAMGGLAILRKGGVPRRLFHQGGFAFHPAGATEVGVRFERDGSAWTRVHVDDATIRVTGTRAVG